MDATIRLSPGDSALALDSPHTGIDCPLDSHMDVEPMRCYGNPARFRHSVQLESKRRFHMYAASFELIAGFRLLQARLQAPIAGLKTFSNRTCCRRMPT